MTDFVDADGDPLPDRLTLKADRFRWLLVLLISAGLVAITVWVGTRGASTSWLAWIPAAWFLMRGLIAIPQVLGTGSHLVLDANGFTCRTPLRTIKGAWRDCSSFSSQTRGFAKRVACQCSGPDGTNEGAGRQAGAAPLQPIVLPDTFGLPADGLADLMNRFRARAVAASKIDRHPA